MDLSDEEFAKFENVKEEEMAPDFDVSDDEDDDEMEDVIWDLGLSQSRSSAVVTLDSLAFILSAILKHC